MWLLNGNPISADAPFVVDDVVYPANWIRLASQEERDALGLVEVPDPAPVDTRFYWDANVPRPVEQIRERFKTEIKSRARSEILTDFPEWKQANMTARGVELVSKVSFGGALTEAEQAEVAALQTAWAAIKALRAHSNTLEAEVDGLGFEALTTWQQHGWPERQVP